MIHELDIVEEVRFTTFQHHTEKTLGLFPMLKCGNHCLANRRNKV